MSTSTHHYDRRRNDDVLEAYMREVNRHPLLTREEETELAKAWFNEGDEKAKQKLINSNLRFVVKVAYKYSSYKLDMIDLIQEGNVGLITAVNRFDPNHGNRLLTYAVWWIKATIQAHISSQWALVRVLPSSQQRKLLFGRHRDGADTPDSSGMRSERKAGGNRAKRSGWASRGKPAGANRKPELSEVARWHHRANTARRTLDLNGPVVDDGRLTLGETLACPTGSVEDTYGKEELRAVTRGRIDQVRQKLNDKERAILDTRILAEDPATLQQLSDRFGISRERVRQVEASIKRKLARKLRPVMSYAS